METTVLEVSENAVILDMQFLRDVLADCKQRLEDLDWKFITAECLPGPGDEVLRGTSDYADVTTAEAFLYRGKLEDYAHKTVDDWKRLGYRWFRPIGSPFNRDVAVEEAIEQERTRIRLADKSSQAKEVTQ